jgi:hypothetical protein
VIVKLFTIENFILAKDKIMSSKTFVSPFPTTNEERPYFIKVRKPSAKRLQPLGHTENGFQTVRGFANAIGFDNASKAQQAIEKMQSKFGSWANVMVVGNISDTANNTSGHEWMIDDNDLLAAITTRHYGNGDYAVNVLPVGNKRPTAVTVSGNVLSTSKKYDGSLRCRNTHDAEYLANLLNRLYEGEFIATVKYIGADAVELNDDDMSDLLDLF